MNAIDDDSCSRCTEPLPAPEDVLRDAPADPATLVAVSRARRALRGILRGRDDRLAVVIGPCSIHDPESARDYAQRLRAQRDRFAGTLEIVMRAYFEKPRTTVGWKGLINDPDLDGSFRIGKGLGMARGLLLDISRMGLPAACEFLDTITPNYLADLVAWGAIGARTSESPLHRELASGLPCPVGFKNGTDGGIRVAVDAIRTAAHPHHCLGVDRQGSVAAVTTAGNGDGHLILRGGAVPNFDVDGVDSACRALAAAGLAPRIFIDASHANSGKRPERQPAVIEDVAAQIEAGDHRIRGVMVESHIVAGRQDPVDGRAPVYGQSITDGCIGWDTSVQVLERLSAAVELRRQTAARRRA